jgi:hypothetical protein
MREVRERAGRRACGLPEDDFEVTPAMRSYLRAFDVMLYAHRLPEGAGRLARDTMAFHLARIRAGE